MKKIISILLTSILIINLSSCANTSKTQVSSDKNLIIGLDDAFPPMAYRDSNGEIIGFDIDLAKEFSKRTGVNVIFQPIDWSAKELQLSSKRIDAIWNGLSITPERQKVMLFTQPYLVSHQVIMVREDSDINTKADLAGKILGAQKDSYCIDALKADANTFESIDNLLQYADTLTAFTDLEIGRIDAVVVGEIGARFYMQQSGKNFKILEEDLGNDSTGIATRLDDTDTNKLLNDTLTSMKKDGTVSKISEKWFGSDITAK